MDYAVVAVPAAAVRRKPDHRKEMVNQLLFGESVKILKTRGDLWVKVRSLHDNYEGWTTHTLLEPVEEAIAVAGSMYVNADLFNTLSQDKKKLNIPMGSSLLLFEPAPDSKQGGKLKNGALAYQLSGHYCKRDENAPTQDYLRQASMKWLNVPYLWGGRTAMGVDCSGLVQVLFKMTGLDLPRDAWQQAQEGKGIKKYKDAQAGDLVFFDNKEDIVHVGILLGNDQIIHSSGKVRIDHIDKHGIINAETGKRGLRLRAIRRLIPG